MRARGVVTSSTPIFQVLSAHLATLLSGVGLQVVNRHEAGRQYRLRRILQGRFCVLTIAAIILLLRPTLWDFVEAALCEQMA